MKAGVYHGPRDVRVEDVPDAVLPTNALVRVTHARICGSDLWVDRDELEFYGPRRAAPGTSSWEGEAVRAPFADGTFVPMPDEAAVGRVRELMDGGSQHVIECDVHIRDVRLDGGEAPARAYIPELMRTSSPAGSTPRP